MIYCKGADFLLSIMDKFSSFVKTNGQVDTKTDIFA